MALLVSGLAGTTAQYSSSARVSDPRTTAGAPGAPGRIRKGKRDRGFAVPVERKHPRLGASQVSGWEGSGFRSGDGAVIHLEEVRGGCLFSAARFRCVLTHSHLRQRLLGRNLITLFSTVNTPGENFFRRRRRRSPRTPPADERADAAASVDARRRRTTLRTKAHKTSGFPSHAFRDAAAARSTRRSSAKASTPPAKPTGR